MKEKMVLSVEERLVCSQSRTPTTRQHTPLQQGKAKQLDNLPLRSYNTS